MRRLFPIIITILLLAIMVMGISIAITSKNSLYDNFLKKNGINTDRITDISYKFIKYPKPALVIDKMVYDGKLEVQNLKVTFSLLSFITFNPKIASIKADSVNIRLDSEDVSLVKHDEFIVELLKSDMVSFDVMIDDLIFTESDGDIPFSIQNFTLLSSRKEVKFSGDIGSRGWLSGVLDVGSEDVLFDLELNNEKYSLKIEESYKSNILQSGKGSIGLAKPRKKTQFNLPDINIPLVNKKEQDGDDNFKISFDIVSPETLLNIKNIVLDTDYFKGSGEVSLSKNQKSASSINFEFSEINVPLSGELSDQLSYRFDLKNKNLNSNISIKELKLGTKNSLNNIIIKADIEDGKLHIHDFSGDQIKANGVVEQNSFRSIFTGKVLFNYPDLNDFAELIWEKDIRTDQAIPFSLSTDVKLTSVDMALYNIFLNTKGGELKGDVSTKFIGGTARSNARLKFTSIDADNQNFPVLPDIVKYVRGLFSDTHADDYLNKFIPIRKIDNLGNYDVTMERFIFNKELYEDTKFNLTLSSGNILVEDIFIKKGGDFLDASFSLNAESIKPLLGIKIYNGSIGMSSLSAGSMLGLHDKIQKNIDLKKVNFSTNISLKKLYNAGSDFALSGINLSAKNDESLINVSKLDMDMFSGKYESSGSVLIGPYDLNFSYGLNSAKVSEIAKLLPDGMISNSGVVSASGTWSTHGIKLNEQLYNFNTKSDIAAQNITINDFSIDDFVKKINDSNYVIGNLKDDTRTAMLTGKTIMKDVKADVEMSKGIIKLPSMTFKTDDVAASASSVINIYDFNIDSAIIFSFYLAQQDDSNTAKRQYKPTEMGVTAKGSIFSPSKEADTQKIEAMLQSRGANTK
ncbi:AsmA-like C-terminal region-containing protein [Rickettsiaceae bacterium]|nr:AsmA-like C-terminal region-containing protein [Rickettsiaceae bacterium]